MLSVPDRLNNEIVLIQTKADMYFDMIIGMVLGMVASPHDEGN